MDSLHLDSMASVLNIHMKHNLYMLNKIKYIVTYIIILCDRICEKGSSTHIQVTSFHDLEL